MNKTDKPNQAAKLVVGIAIICISVGIFFFIGDKIVDGSSPESDVVSLLSAEDSGAFSIEDLLDAIEWVESRGDANAVGDNGQAIGAYQIHKIYVDDVNRILKDWKKQIWSQIKEAGGKGLGGWFVPYTYEDRWDKNLSRDMAEVYLTYYAPLDDNMDMNLEAAARIHNGGPQGHKKESTKPYWEKVKARMTESGGLE